MNPAEAALRLVGPIYDAASDPSLWPEVFDQIGAALGAVGKVFTIENLRQAKSNMTVMVGLDPAYHRLYNEHYQSLNLHLQRARPLLTPGQVLGSHQLCSDEETLRSEYYQEFLRPQDGWFHVVGGCVAKEQSLLSVLSFMRGRHAGHFTDQEIQLLELLMPHLRRAAQLHQVLSRHENVIASLELLSTAALFVTQHGYVQFANRAAHAMVQANDGIGIDKDGCLTSTNQKLGELIRASCHTAAMCGLSPGASMAIGRPSGKRPYGLSMSPIRQSNPFSANPCPGVVVFVNDPETRGESIGPILRRLYDLTAAEARLATFLVDGKDLTQACTDLGIRRTTARTHLRRLHEKLGVKRQAEAVSIILRTVGMLTYKVEK